MEHFSVYCEHLSLSPDDDDETFVQRKNDFEVSIAEDGRYVCTYRKNQLKEVIKKVVERISRLRTAKGLDGRPYFSCGNEKLAPTSEYLTVAFSMLSSQQPFEGNTTSSVLQWDKHPENAYIAPSIHYHKGEITVPEGRIYFVYASVLINTLRMPGNVKPYTLRLKICRRLFNSEVVLLSESKHFNTNSTGSSVTSLRVGGPTKLLRNDVVYVKVSGANSIDRESRGNTFGLFPV